MRQPIPAATTSTNAVLAGWLACAVRTSKASFCSGDTPAQADEHIGGCRGWRCVGCRTLPAGGRFARSGGARPRSQDQCLVERDFQNRSSPPQTKRLPVHNATKSHPQQLARDDQRHHGRTGRLNLPDRGTGLRGTGPGKLNSVRRQNTNAASLKSTGLRRRWFPAGGSAGVSNNQLQRKSTVSVLQSCLHEHCRAGQVRFDTAHRQCRSNCKFARQFDESAILPAATAGMPMGTPTLPVPGAFPMATLVRVRPPVRHS